MHHLIPDGDVLTLLNATTRLREMVDEATMVLEAMQKVLWQYLLEPTPEDANHDP